MAMRHRLYALRKSLVYHGRLLGREAQPLKIVIVVSAGTGDYYLEIVQADVALDVVLSASGIEPITAPNPDTYVPTSTELINPEPVFDELEVIETNPYLNPKIKRK
jgi:hypothetical protein